MFAQQNVMMCVFCRPDFASPLSLARPDLCTLDQTLAQQSTEPAFLLRCMISTHVLQFWSVNQQRRKTKLLLLWRFLYWTTCFPDENNLTDVGSSKLNCSAGYFRIHFHNYWVSSNTHLLCGDWALGLLKQYVWSHKCKSVCSRTWAILLPKWIKRWLLESCITFDRCRRGDISFTTDCDACQSTDELSTTSQGWIWRPIVGRRVIHACAFSSVPEMSTFPEP